MNEWPLKKNWNQKNEKSISINNKNIVEQCLEMHVIFIILNYLFQNSHSTNQINPNDLRISKKIDAFSSDGLWYYMEFYFFGTRITGKMVSSIINRSKFKNLTRSNQINEPNSQQISNQELAIFTYLIFLLLFNFIIFILYSSPNYCTCDSLIDLFQTFPFIHPFLNINTHTHLYIDESW